MFEWHIHLSHCVHVQTIGPLYAGMHCINSLCAPMNIHRLLFIVNVLFMVALTWTLTLASKTSDPREYHSGWDGLRLFFEIMSLLYLIVVVVLNCIRIM